MSKEWKEQTLREYGSKYHYLEVLYSEVALIHYRCELVRDELKIPGYGGLNRRLLAFMIGAIEGFLNTHFAASTSKTDLCHLVTITYGYLILKEGLVTSEGEWCAHIARVQDAMDAEHRWFYELGSESVCTTEPDADMELWESLKQELRVHQVKYAHYSKPAANKPDERNPRIRCALCRSIVPATSTRKFMNLLICTECAEARELS